MQSKGLGNSYDFLTLTECNMSQNDHKKPGVQSAPGLHLGGI
jgi:hypothetical protein